MSLVITSRPAFPQTRASAAETPLPFIWVGIEKLQPGKVPFPEGAISSYEAKPKLPYDSSVCILVCNVRLLSEEASQGYKITSRKEHRTVLLWFVKSLLYLKNFA